MVVDHSVKTQNSKPGLDGSGGGGVGVAEMRERKMKGQGGPSPQVGPKRLMRHSPSECGRLASDTCVINPSRSQGSFAGRGHQASAGRVDVAQRRGRRNPEEGQVVAGRMVNGTSLSEACTKYAHEAFLSKEARRIRHHVVVMS